MPASNLDQIKTIVVVMMENRSFDHMLGYLGLEKAWENIDGVKPNDPTWIARTTNKYKGQSYAPFVQKNVTGKMAGDPPHEWPDIARQIRAGVVMDTVDMHFDAAEMLRRREFRARAVGKYLRRRTD